MKENQNVEFKAGWNDDYLKIVASFANSQGGKLYIGIDDSGNIVGLKDTKTLLETLPNKIKNKLGITASVNMVKQRSREYLEIDVKPSTFPVSYDGKFYIRSGSTTQALEGQELANFLIEKSSLTWDEINEDRATFDDIDISSVEKFKNLATDKIPSITKEKDWKVILEKLRLIENGKIKRACILLFGKDPQKFYIHSQVKIGKFKTPTEIIYTDIIEGNLFAQLENTLDILKTKYLLSSVKFEGIQRIEILEYPYEALREAVINALIHRDYSGTSHIQIRIYEDKLIIMNEGRLPPDLPVEKLKTEHISKPRNPLLASVIYFAGFIENWGRGTLKIIEACKNQGLPEPDFQNDDGIMKVTLYKDIYTEEHLRKMDLIERQIKAVLYVKEKGKITNMEYQNLNNVSKRQASQDLAEMVRKSIFEKIGTTGKGTFYILKKY